MEVEAITNHKDRVSIYTFLNKHNYVREAECFIIGCNVALRASDLLRITFDDIFSGYIELKEKKTGKHKRIPVSNVVRESADRLYQWYKSQWVEPVYLFEGTGNRAKAGEPKPISTSYLYRKLNEATNGCKIEGNFGTHTMRKTYGYNAYKNGMDINELQELLNHSSAKFTRNYIGITRKTVENSYHEHAIRFV